MIASVAAAAYRQPAALPPSAEKIGELDVRFKRNESLYLGKSEPSEAFPTFELALSHAAGVARDHDHALVVRRDGDAFRAHELLQPVWSKGFLRENAHGVGGASLTPQAGHRPGSGEVPSFDFYKYQTRRDRNDDQRLSGTIKLDATAGVEAIVGRNWALVGGFLRSVEPTAPVKPKPAPAPVDPVNPPKPARTLVEDLTEGLRLTNEAARIIETVSPSDRGEESSKATRIKAFQTNMEAQKHLENQFSTAAPDVLSQLREADASLEDANWQLAKKPSPDGRFTGVDVMGALNDTKHAAQLLDGLLDRVSKGSTTPPAGDDDVVNPPAA